MTAENGVSHITPADGNIFADLGFDAEEAVVLQKKSQEIIDKKTAIKLSLMECLAEWIQSEQLKQADAAVILGITRPRVSDVVKKKTQKFTIDALTDMTMRAGRQVNLSIAL
ncbi:XRE family transcriptional regulator [Aestuarium zhoushanense]|nr:XRE family transcriptional regulator [Aestuarium zhoushanense]